MNLLGSAELALSFLIGCVLKATLLLALTAGVAYALRRRSADMLHQVWALGITGSLALPFLTLLLPTWHSPTLGNAAKFLGSARPAGENAAFPNWPSLMVDATVASSLSRQLSQLVLLLWVIGALWVIAKLLGGLTRIAWVSGRSTPVVGEDWRQIVARITGRLGITRRVRVLQCADAASMPVTWGFARPLILLPASAVEWSAERREVVLSHELAHIARHDWFLQICAELVRGLYWFHPLAWFASKSLRRESERACDDAVLNSGVEASGYANQLLELARTVKNAHRGSSAGLAVARPSDLERRFIAMVNPNRNRCRTSRRVAVLAKLATLCLLLPLAAVRLPGQDLSGKFTGTIFDISDAMVPNATIIMTNHKANSQHCCDTVDMTVSDAQGNFVFKALPAGEYEMKVIKPGFAVFRAPQVVLQQGRDLAMTVKLEMGALTDTVDVEYRGQRYAMNGPAESSPSGETPAGPKRIRIGGNVQAAKVIKKVQPSYPESAKDAGIQGSVVLHAIVGMDGKPLALQVLNSQIDPDLARAAVEAVSQWRYQPTLLNGEPVEIDTTITVNFTLLR